MCLKGGRTTPASSPWASHERLSGCVWTHLCAIHIPSGPHSIPPQVSLSFPTNILYVHLFTHHAGAGNALLTALYLRPPTRHRWLTTRAYLEHSPVSSFPVAKVPCREQDGPVVRSVALAPLSPNPVGAWLLLNIQSPLLYNGTIAIVLFLWGFMRLKQDSSCKAGHRTCPGDFPMHGLNALCLKPLQGSQPCHVACLAQTSPIPTKTPEP